MKKLAIFGTSGFAKEILDLALDQGYQELCFLEKYEGETGSTILGFPVFPESNISNFLEYDFAIGVAEPNIRKKIATLYSHLSFPNLIHSQATLGFGMQEQIADSRGIIIAAGARVTNSSKLGNFIIISFNSTVGHDCTLNDYVSIMPGSNISGCIHLKEGAYIGTNATVLPGNAPEDLKKIGENTIIGAGAVVLTDIAPNKTFVGSPAKELIRD